MLKLRLFDETRLVGTRILAIYDSPHSTQNPEWEIGGSFS